MRIYDLFFCLFRQTLARLRYLVLQIPIVQGIIYFIIVMIWSEDYVSTHLFNLELLEKIRNKRSPISDMGTEIAKKIFRLNIFLSLAISSAALLDISADYLNLLPQSAPT